MIDGQIKDAENQLTFALADNGSNRLGNTVFTLRSIVSGNRFTYRIKRAKQRIGDEWVNTNRLYVSVLAGSDNESDYRFLGTIFDDNGTQKYRHAKKSDVSGESPSNIAFEWWFRVSTSGNTSLLNQVEFWHTGRCGRCGKHLTVPESVSSGLGPECAKKTASM